MTVQYRPPEGQRGNFMQMKREVAALYFALEDPATFAAFLHDEPDATMGLMEAHAVEVALIVERLDGSLIVSAIERDTASLEA